jgi:hypothetical protein
MRFLCPQCSAIVVCPDSECGGRLQCPECLHGVGVPAGRCDPGVVIGDFVIREFIGSGGMGSVYRADQITLARPAALKVLHTELCASPAQLARFVREARTAASLNHPNLIGVYAVGEEDGLHYLAMELIRGQSVQDLLRTQGKLPLEQASEIVVQVAAGLNAAWQKRSVVHCDVKPENILLPDEGGVKIADLGLAEVGGTVPSHGGSAGAFGGSPYYVCPEAILGKPLDHRSDLYSLGVTFFEMLTGHLPFEGTELAEVAGRHLYAAPPDPRKYVPDLPAGVADIIVKLMNKSPDERFQSAPDLIRALRVQVLLKTSPELGLDAGQGGKGLVLPRWTCPCCGRANAESSRFCLGCGASGRTPCPLCGEEIILNTQFCAHCGGNLHEQRQGVVRQAESILSRVDEMFSRSNLEGVRRLIGEFRQLDQGVIPELLRAQFSDVVAHLGTQFELRVQEARTALRIDQLEEATNLLISISGVEQYQWLKDEVDGLKSDLAQTIFHAGSTLKSNCPSTCQRLLGEAVAWTGGSLGQRLEELRRQCQQHLEQRSHALTEARAVSEAAELDLREAVQALHAVAVCRVSPKVMVLQPDEADRQADQELGHLAETLDKGVRESATRAVEGDRWERLVGLLEAFGSYEDESLVATERFVTACVTDEIHERHRTALDAERLRDVRKALLAWDRLLSVPTDLLPRQVRREALGFPGRRSKLIADQRRPLLKASLSAVFLLWCLALCLTSIDLVVLWFNEGFTLGTLRQQTVPLVVQLVLIVLCARLLRIPRILSEADPIPLRQPPLFLTGLMLLWILSPLTGVLMSVCQHAGRMVMEGDLPPALAVLGQPWTAPVLVTFVWLLCDLLIAGRYRSPLVAFGMTLSWLLAMGIVMGLWEGPPDTALLQVAVAMYQAIAFALLHSANYLWFRTRRDTLVLHPELTASSG